MRSANNINIPYLQKIGRWGTQNNFLSWCRLMDFKDLSRTEYHITQTS